MFPIATGFTATSPETSRASDAGSVRVGNAIEYEAGAEYQIIGEVDGEDNVIRSFETSEG